MAIVTISNAKLSSLNAIKGGVFYAAGVFVIGFGLGIARTLFIAPLVSQEWAIMIELPVILTFSWLLCGRSVQKMQVSDKLFDRALMGTVALLFLICAELALWLLISSQPIASFFSRYGTPAGFIGLGGQLLFALFPLLKR